MGRKLYENKTLGELLLSVFPRTSTAAIKELHRLGYTAVQPPSVWATLCRMKNQGLVYRDRNKVWRTTSESDRLWDDLTAISQAVKKVKLPVAPAAPSMDNSILSYVVQHVKGDVSIFPATALQEWRDNGDIEEGDVLHLVAVKRVMKAETIQQIVFKDV
jgi:hypothetical protein